MKLKRLYIIIMYGLLATILLTVYVIKDIGYRMSDHTTHYSTGITESKRNDMFLGYYKPLKDSLVLRNCTLKTEKIWYEKNWTTTHDFLFRKSIKIDTGIHFIVPYITLLTSDLNVDICLKVEYPGCNPCFDFEKIDGLGYAETISNLPDTLVLFFGTDHGSGYKDTIRYARE